MDAAKRDELLRKIGLSEVLDAEAEYEQRHDDYVMEMPQSGECIRGRDKMRMFQENYPTPPRITVREIREAGDLIVVEAVNDYEGEVFHAVLIVEFRDGKIVRDTRYYAKPFDPPPGVRPGLRSRIGELSTPTASLDEKTSIRLNPLPSASKGSRPRDQRPHPRLCS